MADVSHELGSLRLIVDSPLSSKVAMFNNQANQHQQSQLLNPFSGSDGRASPKPTFSKDQYGKPLAGSLTEARGQKANMHVMREMLELCQIIDSEGYNVKDEPTMRVIPFGELFNIYNYISDKVVGILLRARKYKLVEFEGEMLFQRRDDDVPVFLLKPILEIRRELTEKIDDIKRASSPAPQATSLLLDKSAHALRLKGNSKSRTPTPATSKAPTPATSKAPSPAPEAVPKAAATVSPATPTVMTNVVAEEVQAAVLEKLNETVAVADAAADASEIKVPEIKTELVASAEETETPQESSPKESQNEQAKETAVVAAETPEQPTETETTAAPIETEQPAEATATPVVTDDHNNESNKSTDMNNNDAAATNDTDVAAAELPTIVIEASAVYVRGGAEENETAVEHGETASSPAASTAETADV